jgi:hypothetical protein
VNKQTLLDVYENTRDIISMSIMMIAEDGVRNSLTNKHGSILDTINNKSTESESLGEYKKFIIDLLETIGEGDYKSFARLIDRMLPV